MINKVLYCLNTVCHLKKNKVTTSRKTAIVFPNRGIMN